MKDIELIDGGIFCFNCGHKFKFKMPIPLNKMNEKIEAFNTLHEDCEKTWERKVMDMNKPVMDKAMWWISNGKVGMSSKTMWNKFLGNKIYDINHPYDPDDFSRCYDLLEAIPEWKSKIIELKDLSKEWSNLVDNWDKLTKMFEQNRKEKWKNPKEIGMYDFMQTLIK